jgi:ribose 5-phosphate isomerase RpiB
MIFTARQLEDLHKANGHVRLPVGSRVTPMASDWLRQRKIAIVYDNAGTSRASSAAPSSIVTSLPRSTFATTPAPAGLVLWWCDGPCGQAKAAIASQARETNLQPMQIPAEPKYIVGAVKHLASEIKNDRATAGVLLVQTGAAAVIFANRCPSLRAILGTCRDAVQQGVDQLAANVLVIEHPYQTLQQVRNLLSQFMRTRREPSDDVKRQLQELASCG